jgi:hypothetical protein
MNYGEAERIYRLALDIDPDNSRTTVNFAAFLLARGQFAEAAHEASETLALCDKQKDGGRHDFAAQSLLYWGLVRRILEVDDSAELDRLRSLLRRGFPRYSPPNDTMINTILKAALERLQDKDRQLYTALAAAVFYGKGVHDLDRYPRWKAQQTGT